MWILGLKGLSDHEGDGSENVTHKMNSFSSKLHRDCSSCSVLQMLVNFPGAEF